MPTTLRKMGNTNTHYSATKSKAMKPFILVLLLSLIGDMQAQSNSKEVVVNLSGQRLKLLQETSGLLILFSHTYMQREVRQVSHHFEELVETEQQRYFLFLRGNLLEVTPHNYRSVVREYLPLATDLHKRLGKRGFRYENLVQMVDYYNTFKAPGVPKNIFTQAVANN